MLRDIFSAARKVTTCCYRSCIEERQSSIVFYSQGQIHILIIIIQDREVLIVAQIMKGKLRLQEVFGLHPYLRKRIVNKCTASLNLPELLTTHDEVFRILLPSTVADAR